METLIKNKKLAVILTLASIIIVAFWLRFYKFEPWLYFKMDQSRDSILITNALENGPGYLPLLGPRAGATEVDSGYLRLGPAYYYMQYVSGILSGGNQPASNAYPDLFFSILALPMLYIFARLYFSRFNSLLITAMYAFSFLIIEYSRFAWNPNSLPFFFILAFYGLLRFFSQEDFKKAFGWIALWSFGMGIGAQLHFFGFFSLLGISGLMILWDWEVWNKEKLKKLFSKTKLKSFVSFAGVALGIFLFVSAPMIISDIYRKGENSKNFVQALSSKPEKKPFLDKIEKNVSESFKYYCLLSTSQCINGEGFDKKNILAASFSILVILTGFGYAVFRLIKMKERQKIKKDFLFLLLVWVGVFFVLSIPVSFQIRPRFYIVVFAVPFIMLGFIFKSLQFKFGKKGLWLSAFFALGIILLNTKGTLAWFGEQSRSQLGDTKVERTLILKNKDGVTLGQLKKAVAFMYAHHQAGRKLYYYVKPEHVAPIKFLLRQQDKNLQFDVIGKEAEPNSEFFAITTTGEGLFALEIKFVNTFNVVREEKLGQITISELNVPDMEIKKSEMFFNRKKGKTDRVFWKDVFGLEEKSGAIQIDAAE